MTRLNPVMIVAAVATGIFLVGVVVAWIQARIRTRGYTEISRDVKAIAKELKGEIFRDGPDLVISGRAGKFLTVVRFSHAENTPALNILMHAPCNFSLFLSPRNRRVEGGRAAVRLPSELDALFQARADDPVEARAFLDGEIQRARLGKLFRSSDGFLTFSRARVEFSRLSLPAQGIGVVVIDHLSSLSALAKVAGTMPGASAVKISDQREKRIALKLAITALVILGITVVVGAVDQKKAVPAPQPSKSAAYPPIPPSDAAHILGADDWHIAAVSDFDPVALANLREHHPGAFPGRVSVEIAGSNEPAGVAYALVSNSDEKRWRLVVNLADGETVVDSLTGPMSLIAAVPRQNLGAVQWNETAAAAPADGDGIMVVYKKGDAFKGTVIYFSGTHLRTGFTDAYDTVSVR